MTKSAARERGYPANQNFPATDEKAWTPIMKGAGGNPTITYGAQIGSVGYMGQYAFIRAELVLTSISGGSGVAVFDIPDAIDPNTLLRGRNNVSSQVGWGSWYDASANAGAGGIVGISVYLGVTNQLVLSWNGAVNLNISSLANGDQISFFCVLPVKNRSGNVPLLNVKTTSPIYAGIVLPFFGAGAIPDGYSEADGGALNQADYPDCFAHYGTSLNTQINPTTGAAWAAPSAGQFRKPDLRGLGLRGTGTPVNGSALNVGDYQADQMQGHAHPGPNYPLYNGSSVTGIGGAAQTNNGTNVGNLQNIDTGAVKTDGVNGTPRTGTETRGKSRGVRWIVKLFNESFYPLTAPLAGQNNAGFVQAGRIPGDLSGNPIASGYLGQTIEAIGSEVSTTGTAVLPIVSLLVPQGIWRADYYIWFVEATGLSANSYCTANMKYNDNTFAPGTNTAVDQSGSVSSHLQAFARFAAASSIPGVVIGDGTKSVFVRAQFVAGSGILAARAKIVLTRVG